MFMGEFKHSIDAKGRLTIPSKIRNQCQGSVYVARGFDGCLAFYTKEEWDPFCAKLLSLPSNKKEVRKAIRFTISSACECEFDKLGRINIPTNLRTLAHLEKNVSLLGQETMVKYGRKKNGINTIMTIKIVMMIF